MTITLSAGRYTISLQKAVEQTTTLKTYQKGLGVFAISTSLTSSTYGGFSVFNRYAVDGVKPMLVYNFENGIYGALPSSRRQELDDLVTITRASTGTYIDASGVIQNAAADVARFDFSTGRRALLVEPSATNLVSMSNPAASDVGTTDATTSSVADTKSATGYALRVTRTSTGIDNRGHAAMFSPAVVQGVRYCLSAVVRPAGSGAGCQITSGIYVSLLQDGTVTFGVYNAFAGGTPTGGAIQLGGGAYLLWVSATCTTSNWGGYVWLKGGSGYDRPVGAYADYSGVQIEIASAPSSRIPTFGSAVTRAADIASIKGLTAGTFDRRLVTPSGTADTSGVVHPGGDIALAPGAYYQSIYYPGGTL